MKLFRIVMLVLVLGAFATPALALQTEPPAPLDVATLAQLAIAAFSALVGWPALLSVALIGLQAVGWLKAEAVEKFSLFANVLVFGGIFVLALLGKIDLVNVVDATFGNVAQLVAYILILLGIPLGFARTQNEHRSLLSTSIIGSRLI
jgi:hypothetical protein